MLLILAGSVSVIPTENSFYTFRSDIIPTVSQMFARRGLRHASVPHGACLVSGSGDEKQDFTFCECKS